MSLRVNSFVYFLGRTLGTFSPVASLDVEDWVVGVHPRVGFVVAFHIDDHVSCFLPRVEILVSFCSLFQRITSIDYRSNLSCFNELFEENEIFNPIGYRPPDYFLATPLGCPWALNELR